MTAILTPARRSALEVLAAAHPRPGRYSNETRTGAHHALVHPQAADWLIEASLVESLRPVDGRDGCRLALTDAGLIASRAAGIEVRS